MAANAGSVKDHLTPEDVEAKTFTPVRLREGYDMAEVDQFLDEVASSLRTLIDHGTGAGSDRTAASTPITAPSPVTEAPAQPAVATDGGARASGPGTGPMTTADATTAAIRVLQLAEDEASRTRAAADADAARRSAEASAEVERLQAEGRRVEADTRRTDNENRARAAAAEGEIAAHRSQALAGIEAERTALAGEIEKLRAYEADYRERLRAYFRSQLDQLADGSGAAPVAGSAGSSRLAALLDSDDTSA